MSGGNERAKKNCLLAFRNKKINVFDGVNCLTEQFASGGYYFDKVSFVAFDSSREIVTAMNDGLENYENLIIFCPKAMENTLKKFVCEKAGGEFDGLNTLKSEKISVFLFFSDYANRLLVDDVTSYFDARYGINHGKTYLKTVGAPVNNVIEAVERAKGICSGLEFNISENYGDCTLEIVYGKDISKTDYDRAIRETLLKLNDFVYALENISLAERLVQLLKLRRMKICVAESFTGGGVCKRLVEVSGVSEVFYEGLNTYSNQSKAERLGVDEMTLKRFGAVSKQTAAEMAEGLIKSGNCDIAVSTTGIAGPKSDNTNKPVGLLYIAVALAEWTSVYEFHLKGSRKQITETAINQALFLAYKAIK